MENNNKIFIKLKYSKSMKKCPVCNSTKYVDLFDFKTQKKIGKVCKRCGYKNLS